MNNKNKERNEYRICMYDRWSAVYGFFFLSVKNASKERLNDITYHNIKILDKIVDYNIANGIRLFRISSDLIPFGSHAVNTLRWWELFQTEFDAIGKKNKRP